MATENSLTQDADFIASDLAKVIYREQLSSLENTLERFHVPRRFYTILGIRDESVCIVYREGFWRVFTSERGLETGVSISSDIRDACESLLEIMSDSPEEFFQMKDYFANQLKKNSRNQASSSDIYSAIKEGLRKLSSTAASYV